jgi:RNA polymerase primary sigma factor
MDKAIDNFDVVRDVKFSTYAVLCIEGAMHNFHRDHKSDIRMPRFRFDTANEIKRAETLEFKGGGTNLEKRVAIRLGVSVDEMRWSKEEYNTDRAYVETEEADGVEDERETERALKEYFEHQTSEVIKKSFEALTPREKLVLVLRCGLDPDLFLKGEKLSQESSVDMFTEVTKYFGDRIFTREYSLKGIILEEVGKCLDVTRERIRQIEVKALRKLRHPMHSGPLREMLKDSES